MKKHCFALCGLGAGITLALSLCAQTSAAVPASISTPDSVATHLGTLEFKDGMPSAATAAKVYDQIDFTHAYDAFVNTMQGANFEAIRRGFQAAGVQDNQILVFSKLMDAKSLFLTANADTVYFVGVLDLSQGPLVLETPPNALGTVDDAWWRWVVDFGVPGPDRGEGGKYLILPPGYDGALPQGGFYVARSRTNHALILGRMFLDHNDPQPAVELIRKFTRIYAYDPGGQGTSIAQVLDGKARLSRIAAPPATALAPELMGPLAAIGIVKGQPFAPDAHMKKILGEAVATGNAASRTLLMAPRDPSWTYYPGSAWTNFLFQSGYEFETPIPMVTREGVKPIAPTGYRQLDARSAFFYGATGITPAMAMRVPGIGSQYLLAMQDADKQCFDGARTYRLTLPKGIPNENFWSLTLYDNQTRSMLDTPQRYPRAGSQSYPSPAAEAGADGATTIYLGPQQPPGVPRGNWIQALPGRGWFTILCLYGPKEPFFTKQWRPGEIERVR